MDTKVVKIDKEQIDDEKLMEAAEILRAPSPYTVSNRDGVWTGGQCVE